MKCLFIKVKSLLSLQEQVQRQPEDGLIILDNGVQFNLVQSRYQNFRYTGPIQVKVGTLLYFEKNEFFYEQKSKNWILK